MRECVEGEGERESGPDFVGLGGPGSASLEFQKTRKRRNLLMKEGVTCER